MNTPALSNRLETYVSAALSKIEKDPELTSSAALSNATTVSFTQYERSKLVTTIKLRRPPKPRKIKPNKDDALRNDIRQRGILGKDF